MKVLFLDIDGVLNRNDTEGGFEDECVEALKEIVTRTGVKIVLSSTWRYTEENTQQVRERLQKAGIFKDGDDFIGHTCHLGQLDSIPFYPTCDSHATRTDEILLWIKCNTVPANCTREDFNDDSGEAGYVPLPSVVKSTAELMVMGEAWSMTGNWILDEPIVLDQFIVLDDLPMLTEGCYGKYLKGHFVHTNLKTGLTKDMANDAVKILGSKFNFKKWRKNVFKHCTNPNCLLKKENGEDAAVVGNNRRQTCTIS